MIAFTKRNLKVFFRDRPAVFFSLLSSVIMIGLYVLFLGDVYTSDLKNLQKAGEMMDNWIMAAFWPPHLSQQPWAPSASWSLTVR